MPVCRECKQAWGRIDGLCHACWMEKQKERDYTKEELLLMSCD